MLKRYSHYTCLVRRTFIFLKINFNELFDFWSNSTSFFLKERVRNLKNEQNRLFLFYSERTKHLFQKLDNFAKTKKIFFYYVYRYLGIAAITKRSLKVQIYFDVVADPRGDPRGPSTPSWPNKKCTKSHFTPFSIIKIYIQIKNLLSLSFKLKKLLNIFNLYPSIFYTIVVMS